VTTPANPLPDALAHLRALRTAGTVAGLREAASWVADSLRTMQPTSVEAAWARGAAQFLQQLADEREERVS
jgi:hypothetical protein